MALHADAVLDVDIAGATFIAGRLVGGRLRLTGSTKPTFVLACMIINSMFVVVFAQALYGAEGAARALAFNTASQCVMFGWAYAVAVANNPDHVGSRFPIRKLLSSPPLYGMLAGIAVNLTGIEVPRAVMSIAATFGNATGFVVAIATGVMFSPTWQDLPLALKVVAVRTVCGLAVAFVVIAALGLDGVDRAVTLMMGVTPVAFNCVTFASMENLDTRFAAGALSISLLPSLALIVGIALIV